MAQSPSPRARFGWIGRLFTLERRSEPAWARLLLEPLEDRWVPADVPVVSLAVAPSTIAENGGAATVTATLSAATTQAVTVTLGFGGTATRDTDYTVPGVITIPAGQTSASVNLNVLDDATDEVNETAALGIVALANAVSTTYATPAFGAQASFAAGSIAISVATGDLNADGRPDLAVANSGPDTVSVFFNQTTTGATTAAFAGQQTFSVGDDPSAVAVGDLNGDNQPDLVVVNSTTTTISVLLNQTAAGSATAAFLARQPITVGTSPFAVALGDINGDGLTDVVVSNYDSSNVSVLLNQTTAGSATVAFSQQTFATGGRARTVVLGDVNGDGRPDIVTSNGSSRNLGVLLNETTAGSATAAIAAAQNFPTAVNANFVAVGDVNGDGMPDLVTNGSSTNVTLFLNQTATGSATAALAAGQTFSVGTSANDAALADVNGDGRPELVAATGGPSSGAVAVRGNLTASGSATASFDTVQAFTTGNYARAVEVADLNGDGRPDLATANRSGNNASVILSTLAVTADSARTVTITEADLALTVQRLTVQRNASPRGDRLTLVGLVTLGDDFLLAGTRVRVRVGSVVRTFVLNALGRARSGRARLRLSAALTAEGRAQGDQQAVLRFVVDGSFDAFSEGRVKVSVLLGEVELEARKRARLV